jgi:hypothetical protein
MLSDDVMVEKLLLTGRMHLQLNVLFVAFHKYVNCDFCPCSLIKLNSNVLAQPTVLHMSHCTVAVNQNFSLLSPCFILPVSIRCMCCASLLLGHTSSVSVGFLLDSYHLGKASEPCKLVLSLVFTADMGVYKLGMSHCKILRFVDRASCHDSW